MDLERFIGHLMIAIVLGLMIACLVVLFSKKKSRFLSLWFFTALTILSGVPFFVDKEEQDADGDELQSDNQKN